MKCFVKQLIWVYQRLLSPWLGGDCRFYPSCSEYALQIVDKGPIFRGGWIILRRILKCHPWHPGGIDLP